MQSAPIAKNERERLQKVLELGILDTEPEESFDVITKEAQNIFKVPIATVTIIDEKREWYKSCQGLNAKEAPREISFCAHAMLSETVFIIEDTLKDSRFRDNPMVMGEPYIRFYAGVSLHNKDFVSIGVFCVKDTKPRIFSTTEIGKLLELASRAEIELNKERKSQ